MKMLSAGGNLACTNFNLSTMLRPLNVIPFRTRPRFDSGTNSY